MCMHTFDLQTAAKLEKIRGFGGRQTGLAGAVVAFGGDFAVIVGVFFVVFLGRVVLFVVVVVGAVGLRGVEHGARMRRDRKSVV